MKPKYTRKKVSWILFIGIFCSWIVFTCLPFLIFGGEPGFFMWAIPNSPTGGWIESNITADDFGFISITTVFNALVLGSIGGYLGGVVFAVIKKKRGI